MLAQMFGSVIVVARAYATNVPQLQMQVPRGTPCGSKSWLVYLLRQPLPSSIAVIQTLDTFSQCDAS